MCRVRSRVALGSWADRLVAPPPPLSHTHTLSPPPSLPPSLSPSPPPSLCRSLFWATRRSWGGPLGTCRESPRSDPSPPALDHIPLHSPLYGGVQREGRVEHVVSLSLSPPLHPQTHQHRAPHVTRVLGSWGGPLGTRRESTQSVPIWEARCGWVCS